MPHWTSFNAHSWTTPSVWTYYYNRVSWYGNQNFASINAGIKYIPDTDHKYVLKNYDNLVFDANTYNFQHDMNPDMRYTEATAMRAPSLMAGNGDRMNYQKSSVTEALEGKVAGLDEVVVGYGIAAKKEDTNNGIKPFDNSAVQIRKNFNETAFFFPDLKTDSSGAVEFSFTIPEALTKWKFQAIAHTKDLAFGYSSKEIVTQKQLMVQPNAPRF
ncbi:MAG: alpha-2-macroglobulin family protein [Bacteroidota bacterium]